MNLYGENKQNLLGVQTHNAAGLGVYRRDLPACRKAMGKRLWVQEKRPFWEAIQTYGWDNIQHEVLASGLTREEGLNKEVEFIEFYKSHDPEFGYNMTFGGQYNKKTEETKRKISRIAKDQYAQGREPNRYWTGKKNERRDAP